MIAEFNYTTANSRARTCLTYSQVVLRRRQYSLIDKRVAMHAYS